ncbi:MAG: succinate dehydrogenase, hydrophobic membrane anchor protein [Rhodospirillales bacterium]|nr:succinate dehydrogenase, hydrophobic membrane anchor protein [Rhodospirillales bacterium]
MNARSSGGTNLRSSLGRARGLGAANEGVHHWWTQRVTAIALVPLGLWFVFAAISLMGADLAEFRAFFGILGNALMMILLVLVMFYHAAIGMQVVIEDYLHGASRIIVLLAVKFALYAMAASCVISVLWLGARVLPPS